MPWLRRAQPKPEPPRRPTALEYYGAKMMPDLSGWWVYALAAPDERIWYAGQSESLARRLDDHRRAHPDLFSWARVYLIAVPDQGRADVVELELIDHYQPEHNTVGRADELRLRLRRAQKPFKEGHQYSQRSPLDQSQAAN